MKTFEAYIDAALKQDVSHALVIETSKAWVRMKCQFGCAGYGRTHCCPPHTPTPEEMRKILDSYTYGILVHLHWKKNYKTVNQLNETLLDLERRIFLDGFYKAWALGCGPCDRCTECNIGGACLHPDRARPSMEACGIDVFKTAREHGLPINVLKNHKEERDSYGLVLVD
jgi:predicted metal-binding protein